MKQYVLMGVLATSISVAAACAFGCAAYDDIGESVVIGCGGAGGGEPLNDETDAGTDDADCGKPVANTIPVVDGSNLFIFCTACDQTCEGLATTAPIQVPCSAYGQCCAIDLGKCVGVCVACCDGKYGDLACKPY